MLKHTPHFLKAFVILLCLTSGVFAGGFQMNMMSMKATSMSGAFTGIGSDASTVFYNPGGMSFLEYAQISFGASFMLPSSSYLSPFGGNSDMDNKIFVPVHLYGVGKLNEKTSVGISVNTPFHQWSKWDDNWTGRYIVRESGIKALYVQPTISYLLSETFGVGAGVVVGFGKTYLDRALPYSSASGEMGMELDGNSTGFGFNLGMLYKPNDDFSLGLNYRSAVKMNVKNGDATFSNVPSSLVTTYPSSVGFETEYTLPSVISAGAGYRLTRELLLSLDLNFTTWKSFDTLEFKFDNNSQLNFGSGKFYTNAFAVRFGAQYTLSDNLDVRGGVAFDNSPVPDSHVSPENPDNDKFMFSLGGSVKFGDHVSLDIAYMLQNIKEREVMNEEYQFGGNYKSLTNIFGFTLNYQF